MEFSDNYESMNAEERKRAIARIMETLPAIATIGSTATEISHAPIHIQVDGSSSKTSHAA